MLQTSTATALALSAAVDPFANPAPSLAVPSHVARLVNFICAFLLGIPAQSLNLSLNVLTLVLALISEIYTSPKSTTEMSCTSTYFYGSNHGQPNAVCCRIRGYAEQ